MNKKPIYRARIEYLVDKQIKGFLDEPFVSLEETNVFGENLWMSRILKKVGQKFNLKDIEITKVELIKFLGYEN